MTSQTEGVGQFADGRLDAIAQGRDGASGRARQRLSLSAAVGEHDAGATVGMVGRANSADEAPIKQQPGRGGRPEQIVIMTSNLGSQHLMPELELRTGGGVDPAARAGSVP
jgi:hypothetical protein